MSRGDVGGRDPGVAVGPEPAIDVDRLQGRCITALAIYNPFLLNTSKIILFFQFLHYVLILISKSLFIARRTKSSIVLLNKCLAPTSFSSPEQYPNIRGRSTSLICGNFSVALQGLRFVFGHPQRPRQAQPRRVQQVPVMFIKN